VYSRCQAFIRNYLQVSLSTVRTEVDKPVIQRNAYFGHPENIILAMLTDERKHIRELGLRRILKVRKKEKFPKTTKRRRTEETEAIREFNIPKLNFEATDYVDLINWQESDITEPPLTMNISDEDLELLVANGDTPVVDFPLSHAIHKQWKDVLNW